jgi:hypothetical protein
MLRRALLSVAILGSLAAPAMADGLKTGGFYPGYGQGYGQGYQGYQGYQGPVTTNNTVSNTNVAAGQGNSANQFANTNQQGGGFGFGKGPVATTNTVTNLNVAAGIQNSANQFAITNQRK